MEAGADLTCVLVIDDGDSPLTLSDERIERASAENQAHLLIIDPIQVFLGAGIDMNRANEVRPVFRRLCDIAQRHACPIILIGHLNKTVGAQSTHLSLGSIDMTAAVRSLLFIGRVKNDSTTRVLTHEKSSLAPPGKSLAFSLGAEERFIWIGEYAITADELLLCSRSPAPAGVLTLKKRRLSKESLPEACAWPSNSWWEGSRCIAKGRSGWCA